MAGGASNLKETEMETQLVNPNRSSNAMMWIAGTAITVFCATGVAALMGWLPGSIGRPAEVAVVAPVQKAANTPVNPPTPAPVKTHSASEVYSAPVRVASNTAVVVKCAECGVIESVREVEARGTGSGLGAVGGAVVGGVLGHQVGGGRGKDLATVAGAVGGAVLGNTVEKNTRTTSVYDVRVRLEDGTFQTLRYETEPGMRVGDKVKVENGRAVRG